MNKNLIRPPSQLAGGGACFVRIALIHSRTAAFSGSGAYRSSSYGSRLGPGALRRGSCCRKYSKSSLLMAPASVSPESAGIRGKCSIRRGSLSYSLTLTSSDVVAKHCEHQVTIQRLSPSMAVTGVTSFPRQREHTPCFALASDAREYSHALSRSVAVWARRCLPGRILAFRGARGSRRRL